MTTDYTITKTQYTQIREADTLVSQAERYRMTVLKGVLAAHDITDGKIIGCTETHISVETVDPIPLAEDA